MTPLVYLLFSVHTLTVQQVPVGTLLQVRLTSPVGSFSSKPGAPISGVVIAPVIFDGFTVIPAGSSVAGKVKTVTRVGYGVRHETASLGLEFNQIALPDGVPVPISARVAQVDNSREKVNSSGVIQGIRSTGSISYRVSGYVRTALLWDVHAEIAEWAIKSLAVALPEPEIYYPAGTELVLRLTSGVTVPGPLPPDPDEELTIAELAELTHVVASMPLRTEDPESKRPSDLTNVLLIGSRQEIAAAFRAAGWLEAAPDSIRARIGCIRAAAEVHGFQAAPMTSLLLGGAGADMSWQKSLNDVSKRHHIRIWKQPGQWNGQDLWVAAATRDVDLAYLRPGRTFTHEIDPKIDQERDKVAYDLAFTGCAHPPVWTDRQGFAGFTHNSTGDAIATDKRMVMVEMNGCASPKTVQENPDASQGPARGGKWQRFARREVLVARSDFLRSNIYYRSFELTRWTVRYVRYRRQKSAEMRVLMANYGPAGSSPSIPPRTAGLAVQSLR